MVLRLLRHIISVALTLAIAFVAVPLSVMGAIALGAGLVDADSRKDALMGLQLLGIAALFWGLLLGWFVLCGLLPIQWRFSLRTLLIATTFVAVVLGLVVWAAN
jgi:hypothetical protein